MLNFLLSGPFIVHPSLTVWFILRYTKGLLNDVLWESEFHKKRVPFSLFSCPQYLPRVPGLAKDSLSAEFKTWIFNTSNLSFQLSNTGPLPATGKHTKVIPKGDRDSQTEEGGQIKGLYFCLMFPFVGPGKAETGSLAGKSCSVVSSRRQPPSMTPWLAHTTRGSLEEQELRTVSDPEEAPQKCVQSSMMDGGGPFHTFKIYKAERNMPYSDTWGVPQNPNSCCGEKLIKEEQTWRGKELFSPWHESV